MMAPLRLVGDLHHSLLSKHGVTIEGCVSVDLREVNTDLAASGLSVESCCLRFQLHDMCIACSKLTLWTI